MGLQGTTGYQDILKGILEGTNLRLSGNNDFSTINYIIDALAKFQKTHWEALKTSIPAINRCNYKALMKISDM